MTLSPVATAIVDQSRHLFPITVIASLVSRLLSLRCSNTVSSPSSYHYLPLNCHPFAFCSTWPFILQRSFADKHLFMCSPNSAWAPTPFIPLFARLRARHFTGLEFHSLRGIRVLLKIFDSLATFPSSAMVWTISITQSTPERCYLTFGRLIRIRTKTLHLFKQQLRPLQQRLAI